MASKTILQFRSGNMQSMQSHQTKTLISCGKCESEGLKMILAEVENDRIIIKRYKDAHTIVFSNNLEIACGRCGTKIYKKI